MERILDAGGDPSRFCVLFAASNLILERRDTRAAEDNEIIRQRLAFLITKIWVCLRSAALYAVPIYPGRNQDVRYIRESGIRRVLSLLVLGIVGFLIGFWAFRSLVSQCLSFHPCPVAWSGSPGGSPGGFPGGFPGGYPGGYRDGNFNFRSF